MLIMANNLTAPQPSNQQNKLHKEQLELLVVSGL